MSNQNHSKAAAKAWTQPAITDLDGQIENNAGIGTDLGDQPTS